MIWTILKRQHCQAVALLKVIKIGGCLHSRLPIPTTAVGYRHRIAFIDPMTIELEMIVSKNRPTKKIQFFSSFSNKLLLFTSHIKFEILDSNSCFLSSFLFYEKIERLNSDMRKRKWIYLWPKSAGNWHTFSVTSKEKILLILDSYSVRLEFPEISFSNVGCIDSIQ